MPDADSDCIFCAIVAGDAPAEIVDSDEETVSFMDINPATRGHALVVPRKHSRDLLEIDEQDLLHTTAAAQRLTARMRETLDPAGFNLLNASGTAGWQTVFHFHIHVIPRYEDDPLKLPWIPRGAAMEEIARVGAEIRGEA
jgi:histidine triad (HIT) family protein